MRDNIRDRLPPERLTDALQLLELLETSGEEVEVLWLLASGKLKALVDAIDDAPPPIKDWRSHLHGL